MVAISLDVTILAGCSGSRA